MPIEEIRPIVDDALCAMLATVDGGQPRVRPMSFSLTPDGRLLSSTRDTSGKVRELRADGRVELCFSDARKHHARVEGTIRLSTDLDERRALLAAHPQARRHFGEPEHPHLVVVEVVPTRVRWKPPGFNEYREVSLASATTDA